MPTGKHGKEKITVSLPSRLDRSRSDGSDEQLTGDNSFGGMLFTQANVHVVDVLRKIADEMSKPLARVGAHRYKSLGTTA